MKKFNKGYLKLIPLIIVLMVLSACGKTELPTGLDLKDTFSEDFLERITKVNVDFDIETFLIQDIEILRQQVNDKTNRTVCLITLSNDDYTGEVEADLTYEYYDKGGWFLQDWEISKENYRPLHGVSDARVASIEENIFSFFPGAKLISRETDLDETLTDVFSYEVPTTTIDIGDTGIQIHESGIIKVIYSFAETADGFFWDEFCDLNSFSRQWTHWKEDWDNQRMRGVSAGYIYTLSINDIYCTQFCADRMNCVLTNETIGAPVTQKLEVELYKCPPDTMVADVIPQNQTSYSDTICYFYGFFNYAKYNDDPTEPKFYGCALFTKDGLILYGTGEESTDTEGNSYIWYQSVDDFR